MPSASKPTQPSPRTKPIPSHFPSSKAAIASEKEAQVAQFVELAPRPVAVAMRGSFVHFPGFPFVARH